MLHRDLILTLHQRIENCTWVLVAQLLYQVEEEEEIIDAPSRVSLATWVTASEYTTCLNTPSLPSTPEILPPVELPVLPNHFTSGLCVPSESS